jgi:hypothetical protein
LADRDAIVARTEGVTASFVKELLRAAALVALEDGRETVTDADVGAALDELLAEGAALTRILLGSRGGEAPRPGSAWMARFPQDDEGEGGALIAFSAPEPDG